MAQSRWTFLGLALVAPLAAQSFDDQVTFRNPSLPYSELLQIKAGMIGVSAADDDQAAGLVDKQSWDGSIFYHSDSITRTGSLDAYAGRDGIVANLRDGKVVGNDTTSNLQVAVRPWQFHREGFYRGKSFVPVGRYEGYDWEAYLGFGRMASEGLFIEFGPLYRKNHFERNDATAVTYVIPEDYKAYGGRVYAEQNTLQIDRHTGMPRDGFLATVLAEREWNDSEGLFGVTSGFLSELPSAVWRVRGRMEWYLPQGSDSAWEIFANGHWADESDRVVNFEAQHPPGDLWVDAQLRLRLQMGDSFSVAPFVQAQYLRVATEDGVGSDKKLFFGAGAESYVHFSESVSLNLWYSYLDNEARPSVSVTEDLHGQHMFFAGIVLRFGGRRR